MTATQKRKPTRHPRATPKDFDLITQPDTPDLVEAKAEYMAAPAGAQKSAARATLHRLRVAHLEERKAVYVALIHQTESELHRLRCEATGVYETASGVYEAPHAPRSRDGP